MRRFWAFMIMVVSLLVAVLFNVQAVVQSNNDSLEYQGGREAVIQIDKRDSGTSLNSGDISSRIMARLDLAGARDSKVEVVLESTDTAQVRISISPNNSSEFSNIMRVVKGNGPISFSTSDNYTVLGTSIYEDNDPMDLTYKSSSPVPYFKVTKTAAWDDLASHAKDSSTDETLQKTIYVWQNKTENDTYEYAVGDKKRDDVASKIIATLSTDDYNSSDSNNCYVAVSKDESGNDFTIASARSYINARNGGDYGFDVLYLYDNLITAIYPANSLTMMYVGLGISAVLMLLAMVILYGVSGIVAGLSITIGTLFEMMLSNFLGFEFAPITIAAIIASVILGIFISVNYFQKVKLEMRKGKSIDNANTEGYRKSFTITWQACGLVFFLALLAFLIGKSVIKSFAGVLIIGSVTDFIFVNYLNKWMTYWITTSSVFSKEGRTFGLSDKLSPVEKKFATKDYISKDRLKKRNIGSTLTIAGICLLVLASTLTFGLLGGSNNIFENSNEYDQAYRVNVTYVLDRNITSDKTFSNFSGFEDYITGTTLDDQGAPYYIASDSFAKSEIISNTFNRVETISGPSYLDSLETYTYYISFEVAKPASVTAKEALNAKVDAIRADFDGGTKLYSMSYPDSTASTTTGTIVNSGNVSHNNFWMYLVLGLTAVFAACFALIVYGLYASLTVLGIESMVFGTTIGILSATHIAFNSSSMFGILAGLIITAVTLIPVFARVRELKKDTKIKHPDLDMKAGFINQALKDTSTATFITQASFLAVGLIIMACSYSTEIGFGLMIAISAISSFVYTCFFAGSFYLTSSKLAIKSPKKLAKLAARKPLVVNKNEPHETIIPGIND